MNIEERVAAYFDRELSPDETTAFENELNTNSELKKEFDFQNDVIEGIKEARKAELKTMLNNIPVSSPVAPGSSKLIQYLSTAVITAMIGFGIYYFWPSSNNTEEINTPPTTEEISRAQTETPGKPITDPEVSEDSTPVEPQSEKSSSENIPTEEPKDKRVTETRETVEDTPVEINTQSARPSILQDLDQEDSADPGTPVNDLADKTNYGEEPITAEINSNERKYNFHYKFSGTQLMLYGEFSETYEILDFIQDSERTVYLYYMEAYYLLSMKSAEITPLVKITDSNVIADLEIRRKSR